MSPFTPSHGTSADKAAVLEAIRAHVHPERVQRLAAAGIEFVPARREGYRVWDMDGRELLDLHLNGGTFNLGHRNPALAETLRQALTTWDIGNHHLPSSPRAALARALIESTPGEMRYVVFTASGSEAVDAAIKSARRATGRTRIVSLESGYHGCTGLAGAAGNDATARHFHSDDPRQFVKIPFDDLGALDGALAAGDVALVLLETIPATCGFPIPGDDYLPGVRALCDRYGTLYAADEVQTGLGRSGHRWAVDAWDVAPDMLITGKGLSGGLYPIAALVMNPRSGAWLEDEGWGHASTFGGAELGCVVALEALRLSLAESTLANARERAMDLRNGLERLRPRFPFFTGIRQCGLIFGLEFRDSRAGLGMMRALYEAGVWAMVAAFDDSVLQLKPGLLIDKAYCEEFLARFENACIWLVNNQTTLLLGEPPADDDPAVAPVRALAQAALTRWGLDSAALKLLKQRENSVFRVDASDGRRFVLRVHRQDYHSDEELRSESAWTTALNATGIRAPVAVPAVDGEPLVIVSHDGQTRQCSLLEWIEGRPFDDLGRVEDGVATELGRRYDQIGEIAARLHTQAGHWSPPPGFRRPAYDVEGLLGEHPVTGRFWEHPVLDAQQVDLLQTARGILRAVLENLGTAPDVYGLIHADLWPDNVLVDAQGPRLIDFDDCGYGWHLFDMATSLYFHANEPYFEQLVQAYLTGYRRRRALSAGQVALLPVFLLLRGFTYLGWFASRPGSVPGSDQLAFELAGTLCGALPGMLDALER